MQIKNFAIYRPWPVPATQVHILTARAHAEEPAITASCQLLSYFWLAVNCK
jgi:hypothetical protein